MNFRVSSDDGDDHEAMGEPPAAALIDNAAMLALSPGLRAHVAVFGTGRGRRAARSGAPRLRRKLALGSNDVDTHSRGLVANKHGCFEAAWNDNDAAARMKPNNASDLYARGAAALKLRRFPEGQADIAAAKAVDFSIVGKFDRYRGNP
jgi:hypothetical protein